MFDMVIDAGDKFVFRLTFFLKKDNILFRFFNAFAYVFFGYRGSHVAVQEMDQKTAKALMASLDMWLHGPEMKIVEDIVDDDDQPWGKGIVLDQHA
jgi:hypothetical protein